MDTIIAAEALEDLLDVESKFLHAHVKEILNDPQSNHPKEGIAVDYKDIFKDWSPKIPDSCGCFEVNPSELRIAFPPVPEFSYDQPSTSNVVPITIDDDDQDMEEASPKIIPQPKPRPEPTITKRPRTQELVSQTISDDEETPNEVAFRTDFKTALEIAGDDLLLRKSRPSTSATVNSDPKSRSLGLRVPVTNQFRAPFERATETTEKPKAVPEKPKSASGELAEKFKSIPQELIEVIESEIMDNVQSVSWDDISGLEYPKSIIQETVVMPQLRPDLFIGLRKPARGILLFGPPGTGKTMIGKCIAAQSKSKFFSISASSLSSKWIGEGEKLVKALFLVAEANQPSVVFIDEIDSMLSKRSENEHESSRKMKTEFMTAIDGTTTKEDARVLLVGATNRPQELDDAVRRRLVKRLYIPLPEEKARHDMLQRLLSKVNHTLSGDHLKLLAKSTAGYSGADIKCLCQEAAMGPIRDISMKDLQDIEENEVRPVNFSDFETALKRVKATVDQSELDAYQQWDKSYGCG